jgi:site-specific DNA-methyltransferase (adenine-specific)
MWSSTGDNLIVNADNLDFLRELPDASFQLIYLDPPFNTGKVQRLQRISTTLSSTGSRIGYKGAKYDNVTGFAKSYNDIFDDYWAFLEPRLREAHRLLNSTGTLYLHLDYREVHYARVILDSIFGQDAFRNEIIWAYDYGARQKGKWPTKHDNILVYDKDPETVYWSARDVNNEQYRSPGLTDELMMAKGALPSDVWWHTIVPPASKERTGYPTQKPLGILRRIVGASTKPGDWVLDFFAGSGTTGAACSETGRRWVMVDSNQEAIDVMEERLAKDGNASVVNVVHNSRHAR